jgi:hypothetical protein
VRHAVVVGERVVDGLDAVVVVLHVADAVGAADGVHRFLPELDLEGNDEALEDVEDQRLGFLDFRAHRVVHDGAEDDGPHAVAVRLVHLRHGFTGLLDRIDEGQVTRWKSASANCESRDEPALDGDARPIRDEKDLLALGHGGPSIIIQACPPLLSPPSKSCE